jgi:hypothetical protein
MPTFEVNIHLDDVGFNAAIDDLSKAVRRENRLGAMDAADYIKTEVQRVLIRYPHAPGTPSPTKPFKGPPGFISGELHDSVTVERGVFEGSAKVYPTAPYARLQEFGGFCGLHDLTYVPPRPYFRPVVMSVPLRDGVRHIFYEHWRTAMLAAVGVVG